MIFLVVFVVFFGASPSDYPYSFPFHTFFLLCLPFMLLLVYYISCCSCSCYCPPPAYLPLVFLSLNRLCYFSSCSFVVSLFLFISSILLAYFRPLEHLLFLLVPLAPHALEKENYGNNYSVISFAYWCFAF